MGDNQGAKSIPAPFRNRRAAAPENSAASTKRSSTNNAKSLRHPPAYIWTFHVQALINAVIVHVESWKVDVR